MGYKFILEANKKNEQKLFNVINGIKNLANINDINLKLLIVTSNKKDIDRINIFPKYFNKERKILSLNEINFHRDYLDKYVYDQTLNIRVLEIF